MEIEWSACENPRCQAKVAMIGGQLMQREWSQNGARLLGYRFHKCTENVPESQPIEDVYFAKWARRGNPNWFRYVGPTRVINSTLLRPPDMYIKDYETNGSGAGEWVRVGIFKGSPDWKEVSNDEIYEQAKDYINEVKKRRRMRGNKNDQSWDW